MSKLSPNHILSGFPKFAAKIHAEGFPVNYFYLNRSRLFTSITSGKNSAEDRKRSIFQILTFLFISLLRLLKSWGHKRKDYLSAIVDTRENYNTILGPDKGAKFDNTLLTYMYDKVDWNRTVLIDRFNLPNANGESLKSSKYVKNHFRRPRLYEERILFSYLVSNPLSWFKVSKKVSSAFHLLSLIQFDTADDRVVQEKLLKYAKSTRIFEWKGHAYSWYFKKRVRIDSLLILDEYSPNQKVIVNACKHANIRCIALQHGGMHDLNAGYVFGEEDQKLNTFPDRFLSWGTKYSDFLKAHQWPNAISTVGHLRTEIIPSLIGEGKENKDHYKIIFASQPHKDEHYTEKTSRLVFKAISKLKIEYVFCLKPHPLEANIEKYLKWADEEGCDLKIDVKDLYQTLSTTDLLLTAFSTVGQEGIYFGIPLITVDYLNRDIAHYVEDGVAENATTSGELVQLIHKVLEGPNDANRDVNAYIQQNAFKIDGMVSERILKVIYSEE